MVVISLPPSGKFSEPLFRLAQSLLLRDMRQSARERDTIQRGWWTALLPLPPSNACAIDMQTHIM